MEAQGTPEVVGFGCRGPGDGRSLAFDTKQLYLEMRKPVLVRCGPSHV